MNAVNSGNCWAFAPACRVMDGVYGDLSMRHPRTEASASAIPRRDPATRLRRDSLFEGGDGYDRILFPPGRLACAGHLPRTLWRLLCLSLFRRVLALGCLSLARCRFGSRRGIRVGPLVLVFMLVVVLFERECVRKVHSDEALGQFDPKRC